MIDEVQEEGREARRNGKTSADCPYDAGKYERGDWWNSEASKYHRWMSGYNLQWNAEEAWIANLHGGQLWSRW